jgi:hypothetical protein
VQSAAFGKKGHLVTTRRLGNKLVILCLLLLPPCGPAHTELHLHGSRQPLRDFTVHLGVGIPVLFTITAEMQGDDQIAFGIRYSRQWIRHPGNSSPDLIPFGFLRSVHGTAVGVTLSYFLDQDPQQFAGHILPNRIRSEVSLLVATPAHDISRDTQSAHGLSWELLAGLEYPYRGVGFSYDIGAILMSMPGMKPVIAPVVKLALVLNF